MLVEDEIETLSLGSPEGEASAFADLYKNRGRALALNHDEKRLLFLEKQREKRSVAFDEKRDLLELFSASEAMDCETQVPRPNRKNNAFRFKMMNSQLLLEIPEDLSENWLTKLCPDGARYLVVANRGLTTCYLQNGKSAFKFKSYLPGGQAGSQSSNFTVLDCIHHKNTNTIFIYDVLAWNNMSLIDAEAQVRFFWLQSKFSENENLVKTTNPTLRLVLVDHFPARNDLIQDFLCVPFTVGETELGLDSALFYHKEGHYFCGGTSPLIGWLRTFMFPEKLRIDVSPQHLQNLPENYESLEKYLSEKKKRRNNRKDVLMDTEIINS